MFARVLMNAGRMNAGAAFRGQAVRYMSNTAQTVKSNKGAMAGVATAIIATAAAGFTVVSADAAKVDYVKVRESIADIMADNPAMGPTLVRLCWHSCGSYSAADNSGGSNGAMMRFSPEKDWGSNAGLHVARNALENVKAKFPGITYADLYTLAGVVAISEMGGPTINWRSGRVDYSNGSKSPQLNRLPDADKGSKENTISHLREVFYRMGFNDKEIVALIGAHAVGRCHPEASGYWGPWTRAETTFSNEYFKELLTNTWTFKKWKGPQQYEDPTGDLMMLPADMAMVWDPVWKAQCEIYMKNEQTFFDDFSAAFQKLNELGCGFPPIKRGLFGLGIGPL